MKIYVDRIPAGGTTEAHAYDPGELDMDREDVRLVKPFELNARINRFGPDLVIRGSVQINMVCTCARCLEAFELTGQAELTLSYEIETKEFVDITEDVRQEVMLAYPMVPHCSGDCKGLCSHCGVNLNLEKNHGCSVANTR